MSAGLCLNLQPSPPTAKAKVTPRKKVTTAKAKATSPAKAAAPVEPPKMPEPEPAPITQTQVSTPPMEPILSAEAELYLWQQTENEEGFFVHQGIFVATIAKQENATFKYWLTASTGIDIHLAHPVSPEMNYKFSSKMGTFTWNHQGDDGVPRSWCFKFTPDDYPVFNGTYTQVYWESVNVLEWKKAKVSQCPGQGILLLINFFSLKSSDTFRVQTRTSKWVVSVTRRPRKTKSTIL